MVESGLMAQAGASMFCFRDFQPKVEELSFFGMIRKGTTLEAVMAEANAWIAEHQIDVINIETVLLPWGGVNSKPDSHFSTNEGTQFLQTVRVWYQAG
ncbi:MAG TPA: hypothetical protein DDY91_18540 [Planctomycetaceae bacterium]|nr:hypothetical protein [Planctomycetaceae bacterium]